jgi:hypothetical protein
MRVRGAFKARLTVVLRGFGAFRVVFQPHERNRLRISIRPGREIQRKPAASFLAAVHRSRWMEDAAGSYRSNERHSRRSAEDHDRPGPSLHDDVGAAEAVVEYPFANAGKDGEPEICGSASGRGGHLSVSLFACACR